MVSKTFEDYTNIYNVRDYGAVGDGSVDDTAAIQATINAATSGKVFFPIGTYRITSSISSSNKSIIIDADGATILQDGNFDAFIFSSDFTSTLNVSEITNSSYTSSWGSNIVSRLQVSDTSDYSIGNIVKIFSDDLIPTSASGDEERIGEFAEVLAIVEDVEIVLTNQLQFDYTTGIRVSKMNIDNSCYIRGLKATSTATSENEFFKIQGFYQPILEDISASNLFGMFVRLESCYKPRTKNVSGKDFSGLGYVLAEYSCDGGTHYGLNGDNVRHAYTTGCIGSSVGNTSPLQHGSTKGSSIVGGTGNNCWNAPFDTHSDACDITFSNCKSYNSITHGEGANRGFQARGKNIKFIDCYGYQSCFVAQGAGATATEGFSVEYINCKYDEDISNSALLNPFRIIGGSNIGNKCTIKDGSIRSKTTNHIRVDNSLLVLEGMEFFPENSTTPQAIRIDDNTHADVRNIWIDGSNCTATNFDVILLSSTTSSANINGVECYNFNETDFRSYVNQGGVDNSVTAINCNCNQPPWLHANGVDGQVGTNARVNYTVNHGVDGGSHLITQSFNSSNGTHTLDANSRLVDVITNIITANAPGNKVQDIETGLFVGQQYSIVNKSTSSESISVENGNNISLDSTEIVRAGTTLTLSWDGSKWIKSTMITKTQEETANIYNVKDYGAVGDGTTDDTDAFNACISAADGNGSMYVPAGVYIVGDISIPSDFYLFGHSGKSVGYSSVTSLTQLKAHVDATTVLDISGTYGSTIKDITINGRNKTIHGICAVSDRASALSIENVAALFCKYAIGAVSGHEIGASWITHCNLGLSEYGIIRVLDSHISTNKLRSNSADGMYFPTGMNDCMIVGNKIEWNNGNGISFYQSNNHTVSGNIFDRNYKAGCRIGGCEALTVTGNVLRRNGRNNVAGERSHFLFSGVSTKITISGNTTRVGEDDGGGGTNSPSYSVEFEGATGSSVNITGNDLTGYTDSEFRNLSTIDDCVVNNTNGTIKIVNQEINIEEGRVYQSKAADTSIAAAETGTISLSQYVLSQYDGASTTLSVRVRIPSTGINYSAKFDILTHRNAGASSLNVSSAYGETYDTGAISFDSSGSVVDLSITNLSTGGSTFDVEATNNTGNDIQVFLELK